MDTMTEFSAFTIEPDDTTNLATNNYTISFSTTVPLYDDDILYMTFPDEVDLVSSVECDVDEDEITTDITAITCSNTGQKLTVNFDTFDSSGSAGDFSFILMDVTNPPDTIPSDAWASVYVVDDSGYSVV
jgi:hypothetical protein